MSKSLSVAGREPLGESELLALARPVRRVAAARLGDGEDADDVVQETLARLLEVSHRLDPHTLQSYAVVTAKNYMASRARERDRADRHVHRLVEPGGADHPEEEVLREEERDALRLALSRIAAPDAQLLLAYELGETDTARLADRWGSTPGAIATRLTRARARLRVEYLLTLRNVALPTLRCKPVLLALSAGDQRRQRSLQAGAHLARCQVCAALCEPLLARRRALAGLLPAAAGLGTGAGLGPSGGGTAGGGAAGSGAAGSGAAGSGAAGGSAGGTPAGGEGAAGAEPRQGPIRSRLRQVVVSLAAVAALAGGCAALRADVPSAGHATAGAAWTTAATTGPPLAQDQSAIDQSAIDQSATHQPSAVRHPEAAVLAAPSRGARVPAGPAAPRLVGRARVLRATAPGDRVAVRSVRVLSVPADEGFWVADGRDRLWVQLRGRGESPVTVRAGARVHLRGTVRALATRRAAPGPWGAGRADAARRPVLLSVPYSGVTVMREPAR